ncbi:MAG TPA: hypothetical protein VD967_00935 [Candidatus Paceibacterota bacterium]|nr:hypothetical protein [Candidatus Paceibacterota bacterium]
MLDAGVGEMPTKSNVYLLKAKARSRTPAAFVLYPEQKPNETNGVGVMFNPVGALLFIAQKNEIVQQMREKFELAPFVFDAPVIRRFHSQAGVNAKEEVGWLTIGITLNMNEDTQTAALHAQVVLEEFGFEVEPVPIPRINHMQTFILPPSLRRLA